MKTTLDLPADLVKRLKLRAVHDGRKLKDVATDVLRAGLEACESDAGAARPARITKDRKTGLPVIECRRSPGPADRMTPERVAAILSEQEAGWALGSR